MNGNNNKNQKWNKGNNKTNSMKQMLRSRPAKIKI